MKMPLMLLAVAALASVGTVSFDTDNEAFQQRNLAQVVAAAGVDDATAAAYGLLVEEYPYAPFVAEARSELVGLETWLMTLPVEQQGLPLRDPLILDRAPWIGPSGVMVLGLVLTLLLTLMRRTRVRSLAAITLLLGLAAGALAQGFVDLSGSESAEALNNGTPSGLEGLAFAYFPWIAVGVLGTGVLLGLAPRRKE